MKLEFIHQKPNIILIIYQHNYTITAYFNKLIACLDKTNVFKEASVVSVEKFDMTGSVVNLKSSGRSRSNQFIKNIA